MNLLRACLACTLFLSHALSEAELPDLYSNNHSLSIPLDSHLDGGLFRRASEDYSCSSSRECSNGACCGESNVCGYGPTYCGDGCQSNCDAVAECGQYASPAGKTCPLNVCCSEFGFCGTTSDFCGTRCQSNCGSPNRPSGSGDVRDRIIGYYESWADAKEPCGQMTVEQIPVDGLTHINFAFAYLDPESLAVIPMDDSEGGTELFSRVTALKSRNPKLEVWVSIGGWTFNDEGRYQSIFPDVAGSTELSTLLADQLVAFCGKYGFDGVDLDWEYPGATERGGRGNEDYDNFPSMLKIIKRSFDRGKRPLGLSITVPTSYWYLRWFDLSALSEFLDWFNIMAYDLHGVWDRKSPIGPYVYAHTNLTEIDQALDLFWRNDISPQMINLGLGFYGRAFLLKDPDCAQPGCKFSGPSYKGICTQEAGIYSYREIQEIAEGVSAGNNYAEEYAVNYMMFKRGDDYYWVSYDDARSFQAKIDFANERGLAGLFIWAIDQDNDALDALRAVTGKDLQYNPALSETQGQFDRSKCYITDCGEENCNNGDTPLVHTNLDESGKGCKGKKKRLFCCPSASAPDPKTCKWRGSALSCNDGYCEGTEIAMIEDNYGDGAKCLWGRKSWCCPTTYGQDIIGNCSLSSTQTCPDEKPQKLTSIRTGTAQGGDIDPGVVVDRNAPFCCPAEHEFKNCKWHGEDTSCNGNRCPVGQVLVTKTTGRHDGPGDDLKGCSLGKKQVFCCDPVNEASAFLPVPLENLFPDADTFDSSWTPMADEAIDASKYQKPTTKPLTTDPNEGSFAWVVLVGAEEDVQTFDKRDGSHLELYDCPDPDDSDYSVQSLKAVCTNPGPNSNCEDIAKGGIKGTVVRLPDGCGSSKYVRAVSFRETTNVTSMPSHLKKRTLPNTKVYDFHYDWNFQRLRRDAGPIHFRADFSNHPGYWDKIVASDNDSPAKRDASSWRELDKRYAKENDPKSWYKRFLSLLTKTDVGLVREYKFDQDLYNVWTICSDDSTATMKVRASGDLKTTADFGQTIIGTLNDFSFSEAFSFFRHSDFKAHISFDIIAKAQVRIQTKQKSLDQIGLIPFGANFNIKGILKVNPYFDVRAQIQAEAVASLQGSVDLTITSPSFRYVFPQELESVPTTPLGPFKMTTKHSALNPVTKLNAEVGGSIGISVAPVLGFNTELDWLEETRKSSIEAVFNGAVRFKLAAAVGSDCVGTKLGVDVGFHSELNASGVSYLGWKDGNYTLVDRFTTPVLDECMPWRGDGISKRDALIGNTSVDLEQLLPGSSALARRADTAGPLFFASHDDAIYCPNSGKQGSCSDVSEELSEDDADSYDDGGSGYMAKRGELVKRSGAKKFCDKDSKLGIKGYDQMTILIPTHPSPDNLLDANSEVKTYGPKNRKDCASLEFGQIDTPSKIPKEKDKRGKMVSTLNTEHVWEVQIPMHFLNHLAVKYSFPADGENKNAKKYENPLENPRNKPTELHWCQYMKIWWAHSVPGQPESDGLSKIVDFLPQKRGAKNYDGAYLLDQSTNKYKGGFFNAATVKGGAEVKEKLLPKKDWEGIYRYLRENYFAWKYMTIENIAETLARQSCKFEKGLRYVEEEYLEESINVDTYVKQGYNSQMDRTFAEEYHDWIKDFYIPATQEKAKTFLQDWSETLWKTNRKKSVDPLPDGHQHGHDDDLNSRAQAIYDATRDGTLEAWDIPWIDDLDNCDGDDDDEGDPMDIDDDDDDDDDDGMDIDG